MMWQRTWFIGVWVIQLAVCQAQPIIRIVPMGNSITQGAGAPGGYRKPLHELLIKAGYAVDFRGRFTTNSDRLTDPEHEGRSGWQITATAFTDGVALDGQTRSGLLDDLPTALDSSLPPSPTPTVDVILLEIGTNDLQHRVAPQGDSTRIVPHAISRLTTLIGDIHQRRPTAQVLLSTLTPMTTQWRGISAATASRVPVFNRLLPALVQVLRQEGVPIRLVDQYANFIAANGTAQHLIDGLHPDSTGYRLMANTWLAGIQQVVAPVTAPAKESPFWSVPFRQVRIPSRLDGAVQPAFFYASQQPRPQPLVVSLHTWSGDYRQVDSLALLARRRDWNYIHPNFRGPNRTTNACCSQYALQDMEDAIDYAIANGNVDTSQIHVIGVSGGGYATLCLYMKTRRAINSFSAWVPITNLVDWYYETMSRDPKHTQDILDCVGQTGNSLNVPEAQSRSPYFMKTPVARRRHSRLHLFAGVHDGYTGAVPITQTILFFNKLVSDFTGSANHPQQVDAATIQALLTRRGHDRRTGEKLANGRAVILKRSLPAADLLIFEGTHEMLLNEAWNVLTRQAQVRSR
ncbi:GDSL-type esterase/lipase family protein [Spirosoma sordidisoli]|uniref:Peptidase S9 prolyl oligopeptidase catalytic domain-containing protein n=1 Tax=Spirosoma sordidisoli TaxID=2502893 RepID=A0A4Q2ULK2_9BACT|nr:GDSL-type esterase/lipase family protein [Spirosoma sordidisoli]RYC67719.1 hypothetical protein EQG79_23750 [Spirosoma sordidisoli]